MRDLSDFVAGRTNRLLRDFLFASVAVTGALAGALVFMSHMLATPKSGQSLPSPIASASQIRDTGLRTTTIVRSVLDDPVTTGSISSNRPIILDPCTGTEKSR